MPNLFVNKWRATQNGLHLKIFGSTEKVSTQIISDYNVFEYGKEKIMNLKQNLSKRTRRDLRIIHADMNCGTNSTPQFVMPGFNEDSWHPATSRINPFRWLWNV